MAENLQERLDELMNKSLKLKKQAKELLTLLNEFVADSDPDYSCLCEIAADLTDVYAKLKNTELELIQISSE